MFVVRADGKQLSGKSGSLPGPALPLMIQQTLSQAGKIYNDRQLAALAATVEKAKELEAAGDYATAVSELAKLDDLGPLGTLGSYAAAALEADALAGRLVEQARTELAAIPQRLKDESSRLQAALDLTELRRVYAQLPPVRDEIQQAYTAAKADADLQETLAVAELLDETQRWIGKPSGPRRRRSCHVAERLGAHAPSRVGRLWIRPGHTNGLRRAPACLGRIRTSRLCPAGHRIAGSGQAAGAAAAAVPVTGRESPLDS